MTTVFRDWSPEEVEARDAFARRLDAGEPYSAEAMRELARGAAILVGPAWRIVRRFDLADHYSGRPPFVRVAADYQLMALWQEYCIACALLGAPFVPALRPTPILSRPTAPDDRDFLVPPPQFRPSPVRIRFGSVFTLKHPRGDAPCFTSATLAARVAAPVDIEILRSRSAGDALVLRLSEPMTKNAKRGGPIHRRRMTNKSVHEEGVGVMRRVYGDEGLEGFNRRHGT